jgi:hypothetical protein
MKRDAPGRGTVTDEHAHPNLQPESPDSKEKHLELEVLPGREAGLYSVARVGNFLA